MKFVPKIDSLVPSQTGNSGKVLTTNGSVVSWGTASGGSSTYECFVDGQVMLGTIARFVVPAAQTISGVKIVLGSLPTGSNFSVDVRRNGTDTTDSIFVTDTPVSITTGQSATNGVYVSTSTTIDNGTCAANDILYVVVSAIGSTLPGMDLQALIY